VACLLCGRHCLFLGRHVSPTASSGSAFPTTWRPTFECSLAWPAIS
jgi:hypothetical protein